MTRRSLLVLLAGLWLPALADVIFRCPPCTPERQSACPPGRPAALPGACTELVKEPGCGCCPVCARLEGESCGVYTPRCAQGLRCYPSPGSELPLQSLVHGQGTCARRKDEYVASQERAADVAEDRSEGILMESQVDGATVGSANGGASTGGVSGRKHAKPGMKETAVNRNQEQQKQVSRINKHQHPGEKRPPPVRTLCQQQLDQSLERIITMHHLPDELGSLPLEHLYMLQIPNCDKSGLYNMKQCKMSLNGQRGECWCVDPTTGKNIPGTPTVRGDPECHQYLTGHKQEERGTMALRLQ
ncbi:insulin-like growth factor-binding protein 2 [Ambystoma mexicanum]|uniref:insulin-like growth factor-binding protein 2 n=1 Tax=Ambystoma mexicanum TaxID=8296 RepID=UPI0037E7FA69